MGVGSPAARFTVRGCPPQACALLCVGGGEQVFDEQVFGSVSGVTERILRLGTSTPWRPQRHALAPRQHFLVTGGTEPAARCV